MIRGITRYQRQQERYTMDWPTFLDKVILVFCLMIIVWLATGGAK